MFVVKVPLTLLEASVVLLSCVAYPLIVVALGPPPMVGSTAGTRVLPGVLEVAAAVLADKATVKPVALAIWLCAGISVMIRAMGYAMHY